MYLYIFISHITICKPIETDLLRKLHQFLKTLPRSRKMFQNHRRSKHSVKYEHRELMASGLKLQLQVKGNIKYTHSLI